MGTIEYIFIALYGGTVLRGIESTICSNESKRSCKEPGVAYNGVLFQNLLEATKENNKEIRSRYSACGQRIKPTTSLM